MISVKKQKKLLFIPLVNMFILICQFGFNKDHMPMSAHIKTMLYAFGVGAVCVLAVVYPTALLSDQTGIEVFRFLGLYILTVGMNALSLWMQSRFLKKEEDEQ